MRELTDREFETVAWPLADYWNVKERGSIFHKEKVAKRLAEIRYKIWANARNINIEGLSPYLLDGKEQDFDSMIDSYLSCYKRAHYTADATFFQFGYTARQMVRLVEGIIIAAHKMCID